MIEAVYLMEKVPEMYLITISIDEIRPMTLELAPEVKNVIPKAISTIEDIAKDIMFS
jgi:Ni,Fe-hydrogenase maturation factor